MSSLCRAIRTSVTNRSSTNTAREWVKREGIRPLHKDSLCVCTHADSETGDSAPGECCPVRATWFRLKRISLCGNKSIRPNWNRSLAPVDQCPVHYPPGESKLAGIVRVKVNPIRIASQFGESLHIGRSEAFLDSGRVSHLDRNQPTGQDCPLRSTQHLCPTQQVHLGQNTTSRDIASYPLLTHHRNT